MNEEALEDITDRLFSYHFFAQRKSASLFDRSRAKANTSQGHGPFLKDIDQSVKYDLLCSKEGHLLGHSHPLLIRSRLDALHYSSLTYKSFSASTIEKEISSIVLSLFGEKNFHYVQFFSNYWEFFYTILNDIGYFKSLGQNIICLGEVPREILSFSHLAIENLENLEEIFNIKESKNPSCMLINLHSQKNPTKTVDDSLIANAIELASQKGLPVIIAELYFVGSYPNLLACHEDLFSKIDYYFLGNNFPLNISVSKKYVSNESTASFGVERLIFAEKMLKFLTNGNFYGKNGRIVEIQKEIEDGLINLSPISNGLVFSLSLPQKNIQKIQKSLLKKGLLCESVDSHIHFYLPTTLLSEHISEICHIINSTVRNIPCSP